MAGPGAYIVFGQDGGEFAFDCLTGSIHGACHGDAVEFTWDGNDEMDGQRQRLGRAASRRLSRRRDLPQQWR